MQGTYPSSCERALVSSEDLRMRIWLSVLLASLLVALVSLATAQTLTTFDLGSLAPDGLTLDEIWGGTGLDRQGRVYFAISSRFGLPPGDVLVFRYTPETNTWEYLASLRAVAAQQGNLLPNERIAKVHAEILEYNGIMYIATHDYHGPEDPLTVRGGHIFAFDVATGTWTDLSKYEPTGVTGIHQGLIGMDVLTAQNKLAFMCYPSGQLAIYDLATHTSVSYNPPVTPGAITRRIIATPQGKVYATWLVNPNGIGPLYVLDVATGVITATGTTVTDTVLQRVVHLRDQATIYFMDGTGNLWRMTASTGAVTSLGSTLPPGVAFGFNHSTLALANDEARFFMLPGLLTTGLYSYTISGAVRALINMYPSVTQEVTGSVVDHLGQLYFGYHDYSTGGARVLQLSSVPNSPALSTGTPLPAPTNLHLISLTP
jgi:hypothetical protein